MTTKQKVINYIKAKYGENWVNQELDEAKLDYLDDDWQDEFDDEHEAYIERMRCEAESDVIETIKKDVLNELGTYDDRFELENGISLTEIITGIYPILATS